MGLHTKRLALMLALCGVASLLLAGSRVSGSYTLNDTADSGGLRTTSTNYTNDGSVGEIGGIATAAVCSAKAGYIGQLTEVVSVSATATPVQVSENSTCQLSGAATMDDGTRTGLTGSDLTWGAATWPIHAIAVSGVATTENVYADSPATVYGTYLGVTGAVVLLVLNSNPDNYGVYAGDQVPDAWQVRYFGTNNLLGVASATNATGQNNLYAYIADLNPTNPGSLFQVVAVSNLPPNKVVYFMSSTNRLYELLWKTNLLSGVWTNLPGAIPVAGNGGISSLSDTNGVNKLFYRVQVQLP